MRLRDKVAIVSGAASGIGRASARLFAAEGAAVVAIDIDSAGLDETASAGDGRIVPIAADVGAADQVEAVVARVALFLAGDESGFVTGAAYNADGGWTAGLAKAVALV